MPLIKGTFIVKLQQINVETWDKYRVYLYSSENAKVIFFVILFSPFVTRNFGVHTCLSCELLKAYLVIERLGTLRLVKKLQ